MGSGNSPGASSVKPYLSVKQQIKRLKDKGFMILDEKKCEEILAHINYYRLSGYFRIFRHKDGTYQKGITFERVYGIYEFDRKLRSVIFSALATIEISFKTRIADCHSKKYGPLWYLDPTNFNQWHDHQRFIRHLNEEIAHNGKAPFVQHHMQKYNGQFPLWAATELLTFGTISILFADMLPSDKKSVIGPKVSYKNVASWLRCATDLRNLCAHHARLYGCVFTAVPKAIKVGKDAENSLWASLLCIKELYPSPSKWNKEVLESLKTLFGEHGPDIDLGYIHFPADWALQLEGI